MEYFTKIIINDNLNLSVVREKGESQNGCFMKTKHFKFPEKQILLSPDTQTYGCVSWGKKCSFLAYLTSFVFLKHPFWYLPFCLITVRIIHFKCLTRPRVSFCKWTEHSSWKSNGDICLTTSKDGIGLMISYL